YITRTRQPTDVPSVRKQSLEHGQSLPAKGVEQYVGEFAHVVEHARAMLADHVKIGRGSESNVKVVRHGSKPAYAESSSVASGQCRSQKLVLNSFNYRI